MYLSVESPMAFSHVGAYLKNTKEVKILINEKVRI